MTAINPAELEIIDFLKENGVNNIQHPGVTANADIYLPDYKLAIDYGEIYRDSSSAKETDEAMSQQQLRKTQACESAGIALMHLLDMEWNDPIKKEIWKSTLLHKVNKSRHRIFARKCSLVSVSYNTAKQFFTTNHLQGAAIGYLNIGLVHEGLLVSVATFSKSRFRKTEGNVYELLRFASLVHYSVIGGFGRILKEFEKTHSGLLVSYANRRWSKGNVYNQCGFKQVSVSGPCYYYTDCKQIWHRTVFQKHKLSDQLAKFDINDTEVENMYNNNYRRFWDCGHLVYELVIK